MSATIPYWQSLASMPRFAALSRDLHVDVAIVGGGIAGLTTAYLLKKAGRSVAVLERGRCAGGDTGHTTAHLTSATDVQLPALVQTFGEDHARAAWDAGFAAIHQIEQLVHDEHIACDFARVPAYLHAPLDAATPDEAERLRDTATAARHLGVDAGFLEQVPFVGVPGVRFEHQARFHPLKYLAALVAIVDRQGSVVCEHTNVDAVAGNPPEVKAGPHTVYCREVVVATHNPIAGLSSLLSAAATQTKLALYTSYVVGGRVASGQVPDALFWDTASPYTYVRSHAHPGSDFIMLGGADHKTGQVEDTTACYERLERLLHRYIAAVTVTHRWSGQVIETADGLPYIGQTAPHQFVSTGFGGNGMTFGTLGAMMATDAITGRKNPWAELFAVSRKTMRGAWDYLKENADYPYYLIRDRFTGTAAGSLDEVPHGGGRVLDLNGARVAAYRGHDGAVVLRSAVCPHMGCIVHWNGAESTWDCPCHGSRFSPSGDVIGGPAEAPLAPVPDRRGQGEAHRPQPQDR